MTPEDEAMLKSLTPEALAKLAAKAAKLAEQYKARYEANKAKIADFVIFNYLSCRPAFGFYL